MSQIQMPSNKTSIQAMRLCIEQDKNISCYFFNDSLQNQVCILTHDNEKIIFKNNEEHSSPIIKTFKCEDEYIVITENTIHIISANTKIKK